MERKLSVRQFVDITNDFLSANFERALVEGEVSGFKINQGKYVFFDLKDVDDGTTINVFMMSFRLSVPLEDGMKIVVEGRPKLTNWGRFSFTAEKIQPVGEGNIKKAFEILRRRLGEEGLFDEEHKKPLPSLREIKRIGVVSSTEAAGYHDFLKIAGSRRGGIKFTVAHTLVQGIDAPESIISALSRLDDLGLDVIAIVRGGGSADDLAAFNDEALVRAIFSAKTPIVVGVGHEVDVSLADLVADVRASTPSNAAEILAFDARSEILRGVSHFEEIRRIFSGTLGEIRGRVSGFRQFFEAVNPETVLGKGYALVRGELKIGSAIEIETTKKLIKAEVKSVKEKS